MTDAPITCPNCGAEFELTEALAAPLQAKLEAAHRAELTQLQTQLRAEFEEHIKVLVSQAERKAREDAALAQHLLEHELADERQRRQAAQQAELELRKTKTQLENRARELDLDVARRVDAEKQRLEEAIRKGVAEQHALKLKEKEKLIDDLRSALEDAKRKSEQGSQERQGEVLEIDVEAELTRLFPHDIISPVPKGARGADLLQEVRDGTRTCGRIVWETKNTKHWQPAWLDKLKHDQRAVGANLAVLVSTALPEGIVEFGRIDESGWRVYRLGRRWRWRCANSSSRSPSRTLPPTASTRRWNSSTGTWWATSSASTLKRLSRHSRLCSRN